MKVNTDITFYLLTKKYSLIKINAIYIMKKTLIYLISFIFLSLQAQNQIWQRKAGGSYSDFLYDGISTLDYGFILAGAGISVDNNSTGKGNYDYLLAKYNEDGDKQWQKSFGGNRHDYLKQITLGIDGGYLLTGNSNSDVSGIKTPANIGGFDIWLLKLDINGNPDWQKALGGLADDQVNHVIRSNDGGFLIGGSSASEEIIPSGSRLSSPDLILKEGENYGNLDYWIVKLSAQGKLQWQKSFGGKYKDILKQVLELPNGNIILAGNSNSPVSGNKNITGKGKNDWWLIKINEQGDVLWQKNFGDEADDKLSTMILTKDNNILLGGNYTYFDNKSKQNKANIILRKIDTNGNLIWKETYDNGADDYLTNILQNFDGTLILGAYSTTHASNIKNKIQGKGKDDFLIIKTDNKGNELWRRHLGTHKKEILKKIIGTRDGGYVLMGSSMTHGKGDSNADYLMIKIADKDKPLHKKLALEAIPNPAVYYTQAVIGKDYEKGILRVFDLNGRELYYTELNGNRIVPLPVAGYPDGIYIINVTVDDEATNSVKVLKGR